MRVVDDDGYVANFVETKKVRTAQDHNARGPELSATAFDCHFSQLAERDVIQVNNLLWYNVAGSQVRKLQDQLSCFRFGGRVQKVEVRNNCTVAKLWIGP